jgi:hypothetical protein
MATTKTPAKKSVTKRKPKQLSARDEIDLMLDRLDIDMVQFFGDGLDSPTSGVARLFTIDVGDDGEIVLDVDVKCNTRITLAELLRHKKREHEMDTFIRRLRADKNRPV